MFETLLELATTDKNDEDIRALASACLLSLSVAYGDTGKTLLASSAMLMSQPRGRDVIHMPPILVSLQRSVISVMLGKLDHPNFMSQGLINSSLLDTFEIKYKSSGRPQVVHSLTSDGTYLYLQSCNGLFKSYIFSKPAAISPHSHTTRRRRSIRFIFATLIAERMGVCIRNPNRMQEGKNDRSRRPRRFCFNRHQLRRRRR